MDFDLHFGRFFGPKIDVFEKFLLPDFELQLEIRSAKIVILPRENAVFYKIDILALKWQPMKNIKKQEKHRFEIKLFFHIDFSWILEPTWMDFGLQVGPPKTGTNSLFSKLRPRGVQEAPKRLWRHFFEDFLAFQCFSAFFWVFLRFSVFFLCFFTAYPR